MQVCAVWNCPGCQTAPVALSPQEERTTCLRGAYDPANPATIVNTALDALWYNVFATNDASKSSAATPSATG